MKYGTQTRTKFIYPFIRRPLDYNINQKACQRMKWMIYIQQGHSVTQCSRHFDVPLRTIWYWLERYDIGKPKTLQNRNTRPHNCRYSLVPLHQRERVVQLRRKYPNWGRLKLQKILQREGIHIGLTRIQKIINQAGLCRVKKYHKYKRRNRKHIYTVPKEYQNMPGGLVYFDVKHLYLPGSAKAYQFTAIDHSTRYLFARVFSRVTSSVGKRFFEYVKEQLGGNEISYVGSDNGGEFLGFFEKVLSEHNVTHVFSSPHCPKQNPFVERVIRTVIDDLYTYEGLEVDIPSQQKKLDDYLFTYNKVRPHESLDLDTPYERYVKLSKSLTM